MPKALVHEGSIFLNDNKKYNKKVWVSSLILFIAQKIGLRGDQMVFISLCEFEKGQADCEKISHWMFIHTIDVEF